MHIRTESSHREQPRADAKWMRRSPSSSSTDSLPTPPPSLQGDVFGDLVTRPQRQRDIAVAPAVYSAVRRNGRIVDQNALSPVAAHAEHPDVLDTSVSSSLQRTHFIDAKEAEIEVNPYETSVATGRETARVGTQESVSGNASSSAGGGGVSSTHLIVEEIPTQSVEEEEPGTCYDAPFRHGAVWIKNQTLLNELFSSTADEIRRLQVRSEGELQHILTSESSSTPSNPNERKKSSQHDSVLPLEAQNSLLKEQVHRLRHRVDALERQLCRTTVSLRVALECGAALRTTLKTSKHKNDRAMRRLSHAAASLPRDGVSTEEADVDLSPISCENDPFHGRLFVPDPLVRRRRTTGRESASLHEAVQHTKALNHEEAVRGGSGQSHSTIRNTHRERDCALLLRMRRSLAPPMDTAQSSLLVRGMVRQLREELLRSGYRLELARLKDMSYLSSSHYNTQHPAVVPYVCTGTVLRGKRLHLSVHSKKLVVHVGAGYEDFLDYMHRHRLFAPLVPTHIEGIATHG